MLSSCTSELKSLEKPINVSILVNNRVSHRELPPERGESLIYPKVTYDPEQFSDKFMKKQASKPADIFCAVMMTRADIFLHHTQTIERETVYAVYTVSLLRPSLAPQPFACLSSKPPQIRQTVYTKILPCQTHWVQNWVQLPDDGERLPEGAAGVEITPAFSV